MSATIVLQRVIPHYRVALFERLWHELGWSVVTARNPPGNTHLSLAPEGLPFVKTFDFKFPSQANPFRCNVPARQVVEALRPEAIVAELSMYMTSTYTLPLVRALRGAPLLFFWSHGYNMDRGLASLRSRGIQLPRMAVSMLADGHVCYSDEGRQFLRRFMADERLFVAPNTIDVLDLQARYAAVPAREAAGRPHVLAVGRLTAEKDFGLLIRVFRRLVRNAPDSALTIVGDGPEAARLRASAGSDLGRRIHLPGAIYDEAILAGTYRSADVVVFPGAVGLSVNHALAYGVPVVAFERSARGPLHHPEIAYVVDGVTGLRVRPYSEAGMVAALEEFLRNYPDPKASFGPSIAAFCRQSLTLDAMLAGFRELDAFIERNVPAGDRAGSRGGVA